MAIFLTSAMRSSILICIFFVFSSNFALSKVVQHGCDLGTLSIKLRAKHGLRQLHAFEEAPQFWIHGEGQGQVYEESNRPVRSFNNSHTANEHVRGGLDLKWLQT